MNPFTPKVRAVIRREFMHRVKSKWFLISTLGIPVLMVGIMGLSIFLATRAVGDAGEGKIIGVADPDGVVGDLVVEELLGDSRSATRAQDMDGLTADAARERLASTTYDLLLLLPEGLGAAVQDVEAEPSEEDEEEDARATLLALDNVPDATEDAVRDALQRASVRARLRAVGVELVDAGELIRRTPVDVVNVTESGEARSQRLYQGVSFGIAFLFYMILIIYGQMIVRSILEEKQSDIVEVMVSSLRPWELMLGKIVGVGAVGIAQIAIWGAIITGAGVYGLTGGAASWPKQGSTCRPLPSPGARSCSC